MLEESSAVIFVRLMCGGSVGENNSETPSLDQIRITLDTVDCDLCFDARARLIGHWRILILSTLRFQVLVFAMFASSGAP